MDIEVKIGHPNDPDRGTLRSIEDEQRLDAEGNPVVEGLTWSQAKTDLWLVIGVANGALMTTSPIKGKAVSRIPSSRNYMTVGVTHGKPVPLLPFAGATIELPSDLGQDSMKRQYIAEWIGETAVEALTLSGDYESLKGPEEEAGIGSRLSNVGLWVSEAAENAIKRAGL